MIKTHGSRKGRAGSSRSRRPGSRWSSGVLTVNKKSLCTASGTTMEVTPLLPIPVFVLQAVISRVDGPLLGWLTADFCSLHLRYRTVTGVIKSTVRRKKANRLAGIAYETSVPTPGLDHSHHLGILVRRRAGSRVTVETKPKAAPGSALETVGPGVQGHRADLHHGLISRFSPSLPLSMGCQVA